MRHLTAEALARLVDGTPGPEEREHLRSCTGCAAELEALREQTEALASLPEIRPPAGDWSELESRLRSEGLIRDGHPRRIRPGSRFASRRWLQAAAAVILFFGGTGLGAMAAPHLGVPASTDAGAVGSNAAGSGSPTTVEASLDGVRTPEEAADLVRSLEQRYVDALVRYRQLQSGSDGHAGGSGDPASRYAALETLVAASQAAIREAPADPFLNGVLASTMAERQATLTRISETGGNDWY